MRAGSDPGCECLRCACDHVHDDLLDDIFHDDYHKSAHHHFDCTHYDHDHPADDNVDGGNDHVNRSGNYNDYHADNHGPAGR